MLLASFIAPFFNPSSFPAPVGDRNENRTRNKNKLKRLSQRERKALRRRERNPIPSTFQVDLVQHRERRVANVSGWTVNPDRLSGEITSWNPRSRYGFIKNDSDGSEILVYARDLMAVPAAYDTGQKKQNWRGFHVEFELKYENQARAVNVKVIRRCEEEGKSGDVMVEESGSGSEWEVESDDSVIGVQQQQEVDDSPKHKSGVMKVRSTRSRRSLARHAEMDLLDWQHEKTITTPEQFQPDYDDLDVVEKRRKGHKLKLEKERGDQKKRRLHKKRFVRKVFFRTKIASPSYGGGGVPRAAPVPKSAPAVQRWVAPKKDTHFPVFYNMFERVATASQALQSRLVVRLIVQKLYDKIIVSEGLKKHIKKGETPSTSRECPVCFTSLSLVEVGCDGQGVGSDDSDGDMKMVGGDVECVEAPRLSNCGHAMLCFNCLQHYTALKIRDNEVLPWISCPAEKCRAPIHFTDLISETVCGISVENIYKFCKIILRKQLSRSPLFVECGGDECDFGFFCEDGKTRRKTCKVCGLAQDVTPKKPEDFLDDGFKSMIRSGALRLCPTCSHPAMKDFGMCNVMECGKCGIFWNWNSKLTGSTYSQVKENGRRAGTLWEAGELSYQQNLQQSNPMAFKALLERNGIKYDPNFVRGRS